MSKDPIERVFEEDLKSKITKIMPKITKIHLYPNSFQKMNVARAVQILSSSVAAALRSKLKTNPEIFQTIPEKLISSIADMCGKFIFSFQI
jgi:hypothetical protein